MRSMSEPEAAYVGALLDGEGWVTNVVGSGPLITIGNTGIEIISALLRSTGMGAVYYAPKPLRNGNWAQYRWSVLKRADATALCERVKEYSIKAQWLLQVGWAVRGQLRKSAKDLLVEGKEAK